MIRVAEACEQGRIARAAKHHAEALKHFETASRLLPDQPHYLIDCAQELLSLGRLDDAEAMFAGLVRALPHRPIVHRGLAQVKQRRGLTEAALQHYRDALALKPEAPWFASEYQALLQQAQSPAAPATDPPNSQAASPEPADLTASLARCRLLFDAGRIDDALQELAARRDTLGANPDYYARLGQFYQQTGMQAQSQAILEQGRQRFPQNFGILNQWLACSIRWGRFEAVRAAIAGHTPANPYQARQLELMSAYLARAEGKHEQAYAELDRLARADAAENSLHQEAARAAVPLLDTGAARFHLKAYAAKAREQLVSQRRRINPSQSLVGQIVDEFLLDPEALEAATAARAQPSARRIAALLKVVREYPDNTSSAFALLVELRRLGCFKTLSDFTPGPEPIIPKAIIQFWDSEQPPEDVASYCRSWSALNPAFGYRLFNRKSAAEYLGQHATPAVLSAFRRVRGAAGKADILRLAVLSREGGIYCDADDRCLAPLGPLLSRGMSLVCHQEDIGSIGNNFLAAAPHHPVIAHALENAVLNIGSGANDTIWLSTGPGQLSRSFAATVAAQGRNWATLLSQMAVLNWTAMSDFCAPHCLAAYKNTSAHWSRFTAAPATNRSSGGAGEDRELRPGTPFHGRFANCKRFQL